MTNFFFVIAICFTTTTFAQSETSLEELKWLTGEWKRTNSKPGMSGREKWQQESDHFIGWGITMKGKDTAYVEKLKIVSKDNALYYVADVPENKEPVYFKFTSLTATGFVCENAANDFPKKIEYKLAGTKIYATISGGGPKIDYVFEKM